MPKINLAGSSYVYNSLNFDAQRTINLFVAPSESGSSKAPAGMMGCPGYEIFSSSPSPVETRGCHEINGRVFFVFGDTLYEISSSGTRTSRGTLLTNTGYVGMSDNGSQVCLVDGANGYILRLSDNNFAQITSVGWRGSDTVDFLDGYFIFAEPNTDIYYISAINDGSVIDALDFASATGAPDNIVAVKTVHQQVWLFGNNSIEIVYDSGAADFPLEKVQGVFIEYGCAAKASVAKTANTVFWLGQDVYGNGVIWMAEGYQPQRISTFAVEYAINSYGDLSNARAYTYSEQGHYFYIINFDSADTTWVYDINTKMWHERRYFDLELGIYERHRGNCHVFAFNKHLISDYRTGDIYEQSLDYYTFDDVPIRWSRTFPHIADDLQYMYYKSLQIDMMTGTGIESGDDAYVDPQIFLDWSDDGGYTWSNSYLASIGAIGNYSKRVIWRRLGRARDRVFRIAAATKSKTFLINAILDLESGTN